MKLRIKEVAEMKGFNTKQLAAASGIGANMLSYYNNYHIKPPLKQLEKIATALDCDVLELLECSRPENEHFYIDGVWKGIRN